MNPIEKLKKRFTPQSRWGAVGLAPRRESSRLTWSEPEERPQPQDGALINDDALMDRPEVTPLRRGPVSVAIPGPEVSKPVTALVS